MIVVNLTSSCTIVIFLKQDFFNIFTFFQTLSVEFAHVDSGKGALKDFMESKGYTAVTEVTDPNWLANDFIFAKKHY